MASALDIVHPKGKGKEASPHCRKGWNGNRMGWIGGRREIRRVKVGKE